MQDLDQERCILVIDRHPDHAQVVQQVLHQNLGSDGPIAATTVASGAPLSDGASPRYRLDILVDGGVAIDYLLQRGAYREAPRPDLVLLDLDLPEGVGDRVLTTIKTTPHLRRIPVIVFTESDQPADILRSYANQGNCYVVKAADSEQISHTVQRIEEFWLGIVTLPLK
jgi:two-component system, chemotaxis family, response regulator Rcp1